MKIIKLLKVNFFSQIKSKILWYRFGRNYLPKNTKPDFNKKFFSFATFINRREYDERKNYNKSSIKLIDDNKGYGVLKSYEINNEIYLKTIKKLIDAFNVSKWNEEEFQKNFLMIRNIKIDENVKNIVDIIMPYVCNYIGSLPVLLSAGFWYSPNKENYPNRSQSWHFDIEDKKQLKVFIPLEKISIENGPMTIIKANESQKILDLLFKNKKIHSKREKLNDDLINNFHPEKIPLLAEVGDVIFCDTSRCYHYGSRKSKKPRKLFALHFTSAFSLDLPFILRKMEEKNNFNSRKEQLIYGFQNYYFAYLRDELKKSKSIFKTILLN